MRASQDQALARAAADSAEELARRDHELAKLRGALSLARRQLDENKAAEINSEPPPAAAAPAGGPPAPLITETEITAFLQRPVAEQGGALGQLRRELMGLDKRQETEFTRDKELASAIRPRLEALESNPAEFAAFQTEFVRTAIQLEDEPKLARIRQIVQDTYAQAVTDKLDAPSRPTDDVEAWARQRDALDRQATRAVQQLLGEEERERFDRTFLGIMGIDLGLNDGQWHRFVMPGGGIVFPSEQAGVEP
jgi:hypothetical protein